VAGFAPIVSDPSTAVPFYRDALGLPLETVSGDYVAAGHALIHSSRTEPWGQTIARLLGPDGLLIGVCHTPWLHDGAS